MEQLTLLQGDSLANLTASPGSEEATKMTVRSGRKCCESYKRQGPLGSLVRMCLASSRWHSMACLLTWKMKDTTAKRSLYQLAASAPVTAENEFGLWGTPRCADGMAHPLRDPQNIAGKGRSRLEDQVALWPTPRAGKTSGENAETWQKRADAGSVATPPLALAVKMYPTPTVQGAENDAGPSQFKRNTPPLNAAVHGDQKQTGSLNPAWVEWLMGYPSGWTDLEDSETPSSRKSQPKSSAVSSQSKTER